ncbi:hypothetical protein FHX95_004607, partial [Clostridium saccharobutylicum]|nr:hypothetical protein [Clostridium saccharobutylicum]
MVATFSSYDGTLISFCNINHISKSQLYYRKKFEKENSIKFHAISMTEERAKTEITVV